MSTPCEWTCELQRGWLTGSPKKERDPKKEQDSKKERDSGPSHTRDSVYSMQLGERTSPSSYLL